MICNVDDCLRLSNLEVVVLVYLFSVFFINLLIVKWKPAITRSNKIKRFVLFNGYVYHLQIYLINCITNYIHKIVYL